MQRLLVILVTACLSLPATQALAEYDNDEDSDSGCPGNSCDAPPGNGGNGGSGGDGGDGGDASASNFGIQKTDVSNDSKSTSKVKNSGNSESSSYAKGGSSNQKQGQQQGQISKQGQDNDVTINNPAPDVKGAASELKKRAAQAARVTAGSNGGSTPCGDHTGLSISTGVAGGGLGTITEACRAFRVTQAEAVVSWKKGFAVKAQYWIGFPFRLVLHVVTLGVLN